MDTLKSVKTSEVNPSIFDKTYELDTVSEFFTELTKKPRPTQLHVWLDYKRAQERQADAREVEKQFDNDGLDRSWAYFLDDDHTMAVVTWTRRGETMGYLPWVKGLPVLREVFPSYEAAMLAVLAYKSTGSTFSVSFIMKGLGMSDGE